MILLITFLLLLSAIAKACMDKMQFHYHRSVFFNRGTRLDPAQSWRNKYKNGDFQQGERFLGSSTVFVWLTDAWHFCQMIYLSCWQLIIAVLVWQLWFNSWLELLLLFAGIKAIYSGVFELFYAKILEK